MFSSAFDWWRLVIERSERVAGGQSLMMPAAPQETLEVSMPLWPICCDCPSANTGWSFGAAGWTKAFFAVSKSQGI